VNAGRPVRRRLISLSRTPRIAIVFKTLRAGLLLILALCQIAPVVALMRPPSVSCGMECCIESGVECCIVEHRDGVDSHASELSSEGIASPCPSSCAIISAGFQRAAINVAPRAVATFYTATTVRAADHRSGFERDPLITSSISPRSPPAFLS
jgi:hypothetical protein